MVHVIALRLTLNASIARSRSDTAYQTPEQLEAASERLGFREASRSGQKRTLMFALSVLLPPAMHRRCAIAVRLERRY